MSTAAKFNFGRSGSPAGLQRQVTKQESSGIRGMRGKIGKISVPQSGIVSEVSQDGSVSNSEELSRSPKSDVSKGSSSNTSALVTEEGDTTQEKLVAVADSKTVKAKPLFSDQEQLKLDLKLDELVREQERDEADGCNTDTKRASAKKRL